MLLNPNHEIAGLRRARAGLGVALLALGVAGIAPPVQDAKAQLQAIEKELQQEFKELRNAIKATSDDDAVSALRQDFEEQILPEFAARYADVARANARTPVALEAWSKVLDLSMQGMKSPLATEALTALT